MPAVHDSQRMTKNVDKDPDESMEEVAARSHGSGNPMRLGVLFKTKGKGEKIRADLTVPPDVLLQFAPKGSYRMENVVEFLNWDLGEADGDGDMELFFVIGSLHTWTPLCRILFETKAMLPCTSLVKGHLGWRRLTRIATHPTSGNTHRLSKLITQHSC